MTRRERQLDKFIDGLAAVFTLAIIVQNGTDIGQMIQQLQADGRCNHCGYRFDHPIVKHGPPCGVTD